MKEVNKEKEYSPKNLKKFEDLEMEEIKNIMGKLSEMHNDIRKMVGNSTRLRL